MNQVIRLKINICSTETPCG